MSDSPHESGQSHSAHGHTHDAHEHHSESAVPPAESGHARHPAMPARGDHAAHDHAGHDRHAGHSVEMFRRKFWLTLVLTIPTLVWGHMLQRALRYTAPHFAGARWIAPLFGTAVFLYGGLVFIQGAVREIRNRQPGMMTLIALAISVAFVFSAAVTLGFPGMPLWEELATLVTIMLLGHWVEMRSISQAQGALSALSRLLPDVATRIASDRTEEVPVSELHPGDLILVRPGGIIPADGIVRQGSSAVNEAMITGESFPVQKREADLAIAGTVNGTGSLRVEVTGTGDRTAIARITRLVEQAQSSRSRAQALADRAALGLTVVALVSGIVTLVVWLALGATTAYAIERLVTVLVIACPHALGLAIPLVIAISTTIGAQNGLLVRDRRGLEEARNLTTVVFDKTGTLTRGEFGVVDIVAMPGTTPDEALAHAAAVESDSEHAVAQGIVNSARGRGLEINAADQFEALPGKGVKALVAGRQLFVGGPALLRTQSLELPRELQEATTRAAGRGQAAIYLTDGKAVLAMFAVADVVRDESRDAVRALHDRGIRVIMMTGDTRAVAEAVGKEVGVDAVFAEVLPEQKASRIKDLRGEGQRVAMVGDGVNDAPALATANVGIAIGAGTEVAVEAGDIVLVRNDPRDVPRIIALSQAAYRKMIQNLWWAAGYNIVAIPLAAGVLSNYGIVLSPAVGAVLMSASTIVVAINAQLLRRVRLGRT